MFLNLMMQRSFKEEIATNAKTFKSVFDSDYDSEEDGDSIF